MKIRIKDLLPETLFSRPIAEKLIGCEISLVTMPNPEGNDASELLRILGTPEDQITYEVDIDLVLGAIQEKHGEALYKETMELMAHTYGGVFLMATIEIPIAHCELLPN